MLARGNRLTRGTDYKFVVRRGRRCASAHSVSYVVSTDSQTEPRFGFIVSKAVGGATVRNTVRRRLKAICRETMSELRPGVDVVIRALPGADTLSFDELRSEVQHCLRRRAA